MFSFFSYLPFLFFFLLSFFFFNDTATTEIYTLSLHDALPISPTRPPASVGRRAACAGPHRGDRKSTRLNSSHSSSSYAVFCLKKKIKNSFLGAHLSKLPNKSRQVNTLYQH